VDARGRRRLPALKREDGATKSLVWKWLKGEAVAEVSSPIR
jgi:hypothetical protein